jgi:hypothetical protein
LSISFEGACLSYLVQHEYIQSYLKGFLPLDKNSIKYLIGNPGSVLRSIVWNSAKGGFVLVVGNTVQTLAFPKLAVHDTQVIIDLYKANGVELDYDKIQKIHREALDYYKSNDIFRALKFQTEVNHHQNTTSAVVKAVFDKD